MRGATWGNLCRFMPKPRLLENFQWMTSVSGLPPRFFAAVSRPRAECCGGNTDRPPRPRRIPLCPAPFSASSVASLRVEEDVGAWYRATCCRSVARNGSQDVM
jgi:hypothetical protein